MPKDTLEEIKRDLHDDLKILTAIPRDPNEPVNMVHDVVAPHALRRAIAAEALVEQQQAEIEQITAELKLLEECSAHDQMDIGSLQAERNGLQEQLQQSREENERLMRAIAEAIDMEWDLAGEKTPVYVILHHALSRYPTERGEGQNERD